MLEDFDFAVGLELRSRTHCGGGGGGGDRVVWRSEAICEDSFGLGGTSKDRGMGQGDICEWHLACRYYLKLCLRQESCSHLSLHPRERFPNGETLALKLHNSSRYLKSYVPQSSEASHLLYRYGHGRAKSINTWPGTSYPISGRLLEELSWRRGTIHNCMGV
jgi:hypothetical protein